MSNSAEGPSFVVFVGDSQLRSLISEILAQLHPQQLAYASNEAECAQMLVQQPLAHLIAEYDHNPWAVSHALGQAQSWLRIIKRRILLMCEENLPGLDLWAREFSIDQVHTGPCDRAVLRERIEDLCRAMPEERQGPEARLKAIVESLLSEEWEEQIESKLLGLMESFPHDRRIDRILAEFYSKAQKHSALIEHLALSLEKSEDGRSHLLMAQAMMQSNRIESVEEHLMRSIELNPFDVQARMALARFYASQDQINQALQSLEPLMREGTCLQEVYKLRCQLLWQSGDHDGALEVLPQINEAAWRAQSVNGAALWLKSHDRSDLAEQVYQKSLPYFLGQRRILARLCFNWALLCFEQGNVQISQRLMMWALHLDPVFERAAANIKTFEERGIEIEHVIESEDLVASILDSLQIRSGASRVKGDQAAATSEGLAADVMEPEDQKWGQGEVEREVSGLENPV